MVRAIRVELNRDLTFTLVGDLRDPGVEPECNVPQRVHGSAHSRATSSSCRDGRKC